MSALRAILGSFSIIPDPKASFLGKNVIITGGNTGIGLEAAIKFVNFGASKVIITTRDMEKGTAAKHQINARTSNTDSVEVWQLDMNSYNSIKSFCSRASSQLEHLDIVILNAAIAPRNFSKSPYGWESTLQINLLSTVLLALMLFPKLQASTTPESIPRLEIVAARAHESVNLSSEQRNSANLVESFNSTSKEDYNGFRQYTASKLFLICAMKQLAEIATGKNGEPNIIVTANIAGAMVLKTTEEGARTYIVGVTKGKESHGNFIQNSEIRPPAPILVGEEGEKLQKRVWLELIQALEKDVPEVAGMVETTG
ncbi:hypothetical protein BGZ60DRAFT_503634 [Tricladium varicosporioides]|nr:hypothetical protein BGZ60DRAFT_503634 [Hymenoscyphus varicosporioides]